MLIVQKYGGTSVGSIERIRGVAQRVAATHDAGHQVAVVVSAMSGETNRLLALAKQITAQPDERECDVLVSTGEQVTVALLAMVLKDMGYPALSLLGHQVQISTDSSFGRARIKHINSERLMSGLRAGNIAVVAGFQGVDADDNITTLGRGGSDTTAVAIAAAIQADACEIYTDVDGVYSSDPRICSHARKLDRISYDEMLELASLGAKVLQIRSVEFAKRYKVPVHVRSSFSPDEGTWLVQEDAGMEEVTVSGVTSDLDQTKITLLQVPDRPGLAATVFGPIAESNIVVDMIIQNASAEGFTDLTFTVPKGDAQKALGLVNATASSVGARGVTSDGEVAKVSIVGIGMRSHAGVAARMFQTLAREGINVQMISTSEIKISIVVDAKYAELAVRVLHDAFSTIMSFSSVQLEIFKSLFHSIAEEMGATLKRTSFSPNIKERRDYSCAIFDQDGAMVAQGDHMPVHLGSMPLSVEAAIRNRPIGPGDMVILNDPYAGGTHLPDITLVSGVFEKKALRFYVASRAHHSDVGGMSPGSMPVAEEIYQEGLRIPPVYLMSGGRMNRDVLEMILLNVRTPQEREGDLSAMIASNRTGENRLRATIGRYGWTSVRRYVGEILNYSERMTRLAIRGIRNGTYTAEDFLDNDGVSSNPVRIAVRITIDDGEAVLDFTGSAPQAAGSINAVYAITASAVFYVFRTLVDAPIPSNAGGMRPLRIIAPAGTVVNARPPAAVCGGNVETSQRIVDVLYKCLAQALPGRIPAASQGSMNNLTIGGVDPRSGESFAYYETVCGGMGARPGLDGISGVHTHMTNSLNTPIEAFEHDYPMRIVQYGLRPHSGGEGQQRGGNGVVRRIQFLSRAQLTVLSDRRELPPYGLQGGGDGEPGRNHIVRRSGRVEDLASKTSLNAEPGDVLSIETPGGGGWGHVNIRAL